MKINTPQETISKLRMFVDHDRKCKERLEIGADDAMNLMGIVKALFESISNSPKESDEVIKYQEICADINERVLDRLTGL
jgi:hypothetical protein